MKNLKTIIFIFLLPLRFANSAGALVNPSLQPCHLYVRYNAVLTLRVTEVDYDNYRAILLVTAKSKGDFTPRKIFLNARDDDVQYAFEELMAENLTLVAFVGKSRRSHEKDLLFYPGDGRWQLGALENLDTPNRWQWTRDLEIDDMFGTFNGSPDRLSDMMIDLARGNYFYPAVPFCRFSNDITIDRFDQPLRGVALYDIDADGDLDIYACSPAGDRVYLQTTPLAFTNRTAELTLNGIKSTSVNFADVNADGRPDLLTDGSIYLGTASGFTHSNLLPTAAARNIKMSAFVELNGDGWPDVVISHTNRGLTVWIHAAKTGGPYRNATAALNLNTPDCGAGENGFFMPGDWNNDHRTDLFYAVRNGLLLLQDQNGRFAPHEHHLRFDFLSAGESLGLTGAGCFAPLWRPDRFDLIFSSESNLNFAVNVNGRLQEMSAYGNEITEGSFQMLPVIAEDLNADGNVDIYAASRSTLPNMFYTNRGYGSFMTPIKYKPDAFPGAAHQQGAWALAAGDVNNDGANDLLLGGINGDLTLMLNHTLDTRGKIEHPTRHQKMLNQTAILTVHVTGEQGVLGARVELANDRDDIVALRRIGSNIATGCRGPDTLNLAVREPGQYTLTVRFSDGLTQTWSLDLAAGKRIILNAQRPESKKCHFLKHTSTETCNLVVDI